ncbi:hypothetical protein [Novosphingobium sp. KA1]|uniref:hypothetical protein n=1 Tax=Novosphingobium sp. (strain KA1) TaxID=164608 RepID=UPI001A8F833C|nr:hypothetical protein [Novosphingobium sp. KA1]
MVDTMLCESNGETLAPRTGPFRLLTPKSLIAIWIGIPLLGGLGFCNGSDDLRRNISIYSQAQEKPKHSVTGYIEQADARGRHLLLKNSSGSQRIFCDLGIDQSRCLTVAHFPMSATVTLFQYQIDGGDYPVIYAINDGKKILLSEYDQIKHLKNSQDRSRRVDQGKDLLGGILFGLVLAILITLMMIVIGWSVKVPTAGDD